MSVLAELGGAIDFAESLAKRLLAATAKASAAAIPIVDMAAGIAETVDPAHAALIAEVDAVIDDANIALQALQAGASEQLLAAVASARSELAGKTLIQN